ncbi:MAG: hypothetical protein EZS28_025770 [Streblomastix strix]|uniref:Uncharacterized protein n=1 Tax=Streblomastix strix TaxID=222440 RepID=A0A5J4V887_9EUKA|nr:MAG: hypothetical protein EZS28_025770 [Streblomastix strix]
MSLIERVDILEQQLILAREETANAKRENASLADRVTVLEDIVQKMAEQFQIARQEALEQLDFNETQRDNFEGRVLAEISTMQRHLNEQQYFLKLINTNLISHFQISE